MSNVVVRILPGGRAAVNYIGSDPQKVCDRWRLESPEPFVIVVGFRFDDRQQFERRSGLLKIPCVVPLAPHAKWIMAAPLEREWLEQSHRELQKLGQLAAPLLHDLAVAAAATGGLMAGGVSQHVGLA